MWRRWTVRLLAAVLLLVLLLGGGVVLLRTRTAREPIRAFLEQTLARELKRPVRLGRFSFSLVPGVVELKELGIMDPTGKLPVLTVDTVRIGLKLFSLLRGELHVSSVVISGPRLSVEDSVQLRSLLAGAGVGLRGPTTDRPAGRIPILVEHGAIVYRATSSAVSLHVDGLRASLTWPALDRPVVTVSADALHAGVGAGGLGGVRLEARGRLGGDRIDVERFTLTRGGSSLGFAGSIDIAGDLPHLELTTHGELVPQELASFFSGGTGWGGRVSVSGTVVSAQFPQALAVNLSLENSRQGMQGKLVARLHNGLLTVERLLLSQRTDRLSVRGNANLTTGTLALATEIAMADLGRDFWPQAVEGVGGRLALSGRVEGTFLQPIFTGRLRAENARVRGWRADLVEGPVTLGRARVASRALTISAERMAATLSGDAWLVDPESGWGRWRENLRIGARLGLKGRVEDLLTWSNVDWSMGGPVELWAQLSGTPSNLVAHGELQMQTLTVGAEDFQALRATIAFEGGELTVSRLLVHRGATRIQAEGAIAMSGRYRFTVLPVRLDLASMPDTAALGMEGALVIRLGGKGRWPEKRAEGEITLSDVMVRDSRIGGGSGRFALEGDQWRWEVDLDQRVSMRGRAPFSLVGPLHVDATMTDLDLAPFLQELRQHLRLPFSARADGHASLRAALPGFRDLDGRIELAALRGQAGAVPWRSRGPAHLLLEAGTLRIEPLDLAGPGLSMMVKGTAHPGERMNLSLSGRVPFDLFGPWATSVTDLQGTAEVRLSAVGRHDGVEVTGQANLSGVSARLAHLAIPIAVEKGGLTLDSGNLEYAISEGTAAGGRLQGRGKIWFEDGQRRQAIHFRLDRASMDLLFDQIQSDHRWASGELTTSGSLVFDATPGRPAVQSMSGRLSVALEGGSLSRYPPLVRMFGLLGFPVQPYRLPDLTRERMLYHRISADFAVKEGVMETQNLLLDSEVVMVAGVGKVIPAEQRVELDVGVRPLQVMEQGIRRIPLLAWILPRKQSLAVAYFTMDGPWHDPTVSIASVKSLLQTVVNNLLLILRTPERLVGPGR